MAKIDRGVLQGVIREWMKSSGSSLTAKTSLRMLAGLEKVHGDDFSIKRACIALSSLATDSERIKDDLEQALREAKE